MVLRTLLIDAFLKEELRLGAEQFVILGAGLDGRAHRLQELSQVNVFEVDHPATQSYKKQHAASLPSLSKSLTYIAVNFERDSLRAALEAGGHQKTQPTIWLWEGVVMYLTDEAIRGTLRTIAEQSAPSSGLILNYHTPTTRLPWKNLLLGLWGEPQRAGYSQESMAAEINAVGMRVIKDSGLPECAERFHTELPKMGVAQQVRVLVARR
jgi:methyltransferase (TIGR00027 family)